MFSKIHTSPKIQYLFDAIGVFSLASFLAIGFHPDFIQDLIPRCNFAVDFLQKILACGQDPFSKAQALYLIFYHPFIIFVLPYIAAIFIKELISAEFIAAILLFLALFIITLSVFTSLRLIFKTSKRLLSNPHGRKNILWLIIPVFTPLILLSALKFFMIPPAYSQKIISVDVWHAQFQVPRKELENWSLIKIEKPTTQARPENPFQHLSSVPPELFRPKKAKPFVTIKIPDQIADGMLIPHPNKKSVYIVPRNSALTPAELHQNQEDALQRILRVPYYTENPLARRLYPKSPEKDGLWTVYRNGNHQSIHEPDVYVLRDSDHHIIAIVECTSLLNADKKHQTCVEKEGGDEHFKFNFPMFYKQALADYPQNRKIITTQINSYKK